MSKDAYKMTIKRMQSGKNKNIFNEYNIPIVLVAKP